MLRHAKVRRTNFSALQIPLHPQAFDPDRARVSYSSLLSYITLHYIYNQYDSETIPIRAKSDNLWNIQTVSGVQGVNGEFVNFLDVVRRRRRRVRAARTPAGRLPS